MHTTDLPRAKALDLIASYATFKANLDAATAPILAQIASLQAALATATCGTKARLEAIENEAKELALKHGPEIFGPDKRSLVECGHILAVRDTEVVKVEDEAAAIARLRKVAAHPHAQIETILACQACLRETVELNKPYILEHFANAPEWFADFGISVEERQSASLKPAPKPRAAKPKTKAKARQDDLSTEAA